jgi:hypothetical protein
MVVVRETHGATRMTCWSGSSPTGCTPIHQKKGYMDVTVHFIDDDWVLNFFLLR